MDAKKAIAELKAILQENQFMDKNAVIYMWQKIKTYVGNIAAKKVDKVEGKGLSTNDLTDELLEKLNNAGDSSFTGVYADLTGKSTINGFEINGTVTLDQIGAQPKGNYLTTVPAEYVTETELAGKGFQTSQQVETAITGKGYQTASQVETTITGKGYQTAPQVESAITSKGYQTAGQVTQAITTELGKITKFNMKVLGAEEELPQTGVVGTIYLKPIVSGSEPNMYEEYVWIATTSKYEQIGTKEIDLSGYWNETNLRAITNGELDEILV